MSLVGTQRNAVADEIVHSLTRSIPVEEMRQKRGYRRASRSFEIRIKPMTGAPEKPSIEFLGELLSMNADRLHVKNVQLNDLSPNSGRYSSVSLERNEAIYDIVLAEGSNRGEQFERKMLRKLKSHVRAIKNDEDAEKFLQAIHRADPEFDPNSVIDAKPRTGTTKRSGAGLGESGKIIGDVVLEMIDGSNVYVSIKNITGDTIANLGGVSTAFDPTTFEIDGNSSVWNIVDDAGFDPEKIAAGLRAFKASEEPGFQTVVSTNRRIGSGSPLYKLLKFAWGEGYFYVRQIKDGFKAFNVTEDYVRDTLLNSLKVTEIRYPGSTKQITAKIEGPNVTHRMEIRNSQSGKIKPDEIKIRATL